MSLNVECSHLSTRLWWNPWPKHHPFILDINCLQPLSHTCSILNFWRSSGSVVHWYGGRWKYLKWRFSGWFKSVIYYLFLGEQETVFLSFSMVKLYTVSWDKKNCSIRESSLINWSWIWRPQNSLRMTGSPSFCGLMSIGIGRGTLFLLWVEFVWDQ